MNKPFNIIIVARRNPDDEILAVGTDFKEVDDRGRKALKKGETFYLRTFAEVQEGEILCERNHCYEQHFNFCPHCGGKLKYREDEY
jgi:hypothetical protein